MESLKDQHGIVFDIKRFAVHDGPGIRTTVFLKGCNMTCWWCHNPESKSSRRELFFFCAKCRYCGRCVGVCPQQAHSISVGKNQPTHRISREKCTLCGTCVRSCPFEALKIIGQIRTAGDVLNEVLEDKHFYVTSGGGATISGGEPMLQEDFVYALLRLAKDAGVNTALDTNGGNRQDGYKKLLPVTDLFLFDLKQMNAEKHIEKCGVSLEKILKNLQWLSDNGAKIILRCPVIPQVNAEDNDHWHQVAETAFRLSGVTAIEYLPYHRFWISKSQGLGLTFSGEMTGLPEISNQRLVDIEAILNQSGKPVSRGYK